MLVTIAYNNGVLIETMANKKLYESMVRAQQRYKEMAESGLSRYVDQDQVSCFTKGMQQLGYSPTLGYVQDLLADENKLLNSLVQKDYRPWRVFVTFATQSQQLHCLRATKTSHFQIMSGSAPGSAANFDGTCGSQRRRVLRVLCARRIRWRH